MLNSAQRLTANLIEEEIQEATKLQGLSAGAGRQLFPYFFRSCVCALAEQCKDPGDENLIAWPAPFVAGTNARFHPTTFREINPGAGCGGSRMSGAEKSEDLELITIQFEPEGYKIIVLARDQERAEHFRKTAKAADRS